jgi:hypothetical protein
VRIKRLGILIFFLIALAISSIAYGEVKIQKNGYTVSIPDGWIEIPRDVLVQSEKAISDMLPNVERPHYECGFQLKSKENWLDYPYVLIELKNVGRIPKSELKKIDGFSMQETFDSRKKNYDNIISNIKAGEMIYDNENKIIWLGFETTVQDIGPIANIGAMILTEKGFIQAGAYSKKDEYAAYESVLRLIVKSVTPSPELAYKPKWSDNLPVAITGIDWGKVAARALIGAVTGGIIALIAVLFRRKKKE